MTYIEKNLMPNEKILFSAKVSPFIFIPAVFTFVGTILFIIALLITKDEAGKIMNALIAGMFFIFTIRLAMEATVAMLTTEFAITNQRIIAKKGFIHRNTLEMLLHKIESVNVYQNIMGRIMNFGTVTVIGTGGTRESFRAIIDPTDVRKKINQVVAHFEKERK